MNRLSLFRGRVRHIDRLRRALLVFSLLGIVPGGLAAAADIAAAAPVPVEAVLTALPADTLLAQAPRIVELLLQAHGLDRLPARLRTRLRTEVLADFAELDLAGGWRDALATLPVSTLEAAAGQLQQPAARQLRQAQASPADAGQWQALRDYRIRLQTHPPPAVRAALIAQVVDAGADVELSALLQTGIERLLMQRATAAGVSVNRPADGEWPWLLAQRRGAQRNAQIEYSFFSYRYLSNDVLEAYVRLAEHEAVADVRQLLLRVARERLMESGASGG